jgi:hypothetical protein
MIESSSAKQVELVRDIRRNLLHSMWVDSKDKSKSLFAEFEYPEKGPKSIYDLGAPKEAKIVPFSVSNDIQQLIEKLDNLRQTSFRSYVAVSIPANIDEFPTSFTDYRPHRYFTVKDKLVCSIWRNDEKRYRSQGYFSEEWGSVPSLESISENVRSAAVLLIPVSANIYHKNRIYHYQVLGNKSVRSMRKGFIEVYGKETFIEQICWPQITIPRNRAVKCKIESVPGLADESLLMIERALESGIVERWFLNPTRNYICERNELFNGNSLLSVWEILEYSRTPNGQWYPRKIQKKEYRQSKKDGEQLPDTAARIIYIEENPVFPKGLFDPDYLPKADK